MIPLGCVVCPHCTRTLLAVTSVIEMFLGGDPGALKSNKYNI